MRPRSQGPSDGQGARRELDAGWNEVLDPSRHASASTEAAASHEDADADAGPRVAESSSVDLPTATLEQDDALPDEPIVRERVARDMDAMMSGSWAMATREGSSTPEEPVASASSSSMRGLRESDAEMAAIMGTREPRSKPIGEVGAGPSSAAIADAATREPSSSTAKPSDTAAPSRTLPSSTPRPRTTTPLPSRGGPPIAASGTIEPDPEPDRELPLPPARAVRPQTGPLGVVRPVTPRRMSSGEPRRIAARGAGLELGAPAKRLSLGWAVVAGIGIAGIAWLVGGPIRRPGAAPSGDPKSVASTGVMSAPADAPALPGRAPTTDPSGPVALGNAEGEVAPIERPEPEAAPAPTPVVPAPSPQPPSARGVRTPPPGTPPEIAATFVRLPVSPADLPPVGGIGAGGIHIDRVEMGASYDNKSGCVGVATSFSVAANEEINVCLRVVHPRQDEVMSIVWQKNDGSTARRGKIAVKPIHAYRTRAYLRLRAEYIGAWTVRIVSADGVELASHAFKITA